jgi:prepilin-type N-terminal cleavage/methylation domain-containing protein
VSPAGRHPERGFTLVEVIVVMMLAGIVTLGLVTFYLHSQGTWIDASTQALAQRDGTSALEAIGARTGLGHRADLIPVAGYADNFDLQIYDTSDSMIARYFWEPTDSLLHFGDGGNIDRGPVVPTIVERFAVRLEDSLGLVHVDTLRLRSAMGQRIVMSSTFGMYNRPTSP